ncbi:MAG: MerR family transcriptional regulator [Micromonosporaceae bacterium]
MFSIGDFARHGRVSIRMLRHYDTIGLLRPAQVDPASGYRFYTADQLSQLNRVVALKDLGFTLQQVATLLDEQVSVEQLRGMLRLRRAELATRIAADTAKLSQVEARLSAIEREGRMPTVEIQIKSLPAVRVAELTAVAASYEPPDIGPVISPLYDELCGRLDRAGVEITGPAIAYYEDAPDGGILVHAGMTVNADPSEKYDFAIVDLPSVPEAATAVHHGSMDAVSTTYGALAKWIQANSYRGTGFAREYYIKAAPADQSEWVTELQEPIARD